MTVWRAASTRCVSALLRSPAHRLLDRQLVVLTYVGRRSERRISVPVAFARDGDELIVFVGNHDEKRWWRNFEHESPLRLRLGGRDYDARARAVRTDRAARDAYEHRFPRSREHVGREHVPLFVRITDVRAVAAIPNPEAGA